MKNKQIQPSIVVLVPCFNEGVAIGKVVQDFAHALPAATIYVYDNNSTDNTKSVAKDAGATVREESLQGKGSVVRRMFADVEADIYVLVDGDDTYDAASAPKLIKCLVDNHLDMVVGSRLSDHEGEAFPQGHRFGNHLLTYSASLFFGRKLADMLSGYRVFSRRFVKSFPALSAGFETETELTVHAMELRLPFQEISTPYKMRPIGSESKLSTYKDGTRILLTILSLFKNERPLLFFSILFSILTVLSLILGYPIIVEYLQTGLVPRFPTAILSTGIMLLAFLSLASGFILDTVTRARQEIKRLAYLAIPRFDGTILGNTKLENRD